MEVATLVADGAASWTLVTVDILDYPINTHTHTYTRTDTLKQKNKICICPTLLNLQCSSDRMTRWTRTQHLFFWSFLASPDHFLCLCQSHFFPICSSAARESALWHLQWPADEGLCSWYASLHVPPTAATSARSSHVEGRVVIRLGRECGRMCIGWVSCSALTYPPTYPGSVSVGGWNQTRAVDWVDSNKFIHFRGPVGDIIDHIRRGRRVGADGPPVPFLCSNPSHPVWGQLTEQRMSVNSWCVWPHENKPIPRRDIHYLPPARLPSHFLNRLWGSTWTADYSAAYPAQRRQLKINSMLSLEQKNEF